MKEEIEQIIQQCQSTDPLDGTIYIHSNQFEELTSQIIKLIQDGSLH